MCGTREKTLVAECPPRVTDGRETQDRTREAQGGEQAGRWGWQGSPRGNRRKRQPLQSPWIRWASSPALSLPPVHPLSTHLPWGERSWVSWYLTKGLCAYVNLVQHILLFLKKPLCSVAFQGMGVLYIPSAPNICSCGFFVTPSLEILLLL